jgi:hypothetical protein
MVGFGGHGELQIVANKFSVHDRSIARRANLTISYKIKIMEFGISISNKYGRGIGLPILA